jgi:hypothetical protein
MEPAGFSLREPERTSPTDVSSGVGTAGRRDPNRLAMFTLGLEAGGSRPARRNPR